MFDFFVNNSWIIPTLPLWAFLIIIFGLNLNVFESKKTTLLITCVSTGIGLITSICLLINALIHKGAVYESSVLWLNTDNIRLSAGILVDNLAIMMLMLVTSVSLLIQIYSYEYMKEDSGFHRFFAYLNLFNFSMLSLVLSSNLIQMYIFWELVGLSSYLLIGFWFVRPSAAKAATKAFIINRIGDFGFLAGIIGFLYYSFDFWVTRNDSFLAFSSLAQASQFALNNAGIVIFSIIAFGLFLGAVAKSAQIPLHTWLPDAMEGPTPISALIHAATMVAAGVYLIARVYPIFQLTPHIMTIIAWTGAITAFVAATIAVVQHDIKKVLAYSTCSQLGYMVMALGAGAYSAGLFHLFTHGFFKAMLFLCAGAVIHSLGDQQDMRYLGGLRKHMPVVAYTYLIGVLAISGIIFSGFWSKEEIFGHLLETHQYAFLAIGILTALMTAFYMFRSYFLTFEGEYKGHSHVHKAKPFLTLPLVILAVPTVLIGLLLSGNIPSLPSFDFFISNNLPAHHSLLLPVISLIVAITGAVAATLFYSDILKVRFSPDYFVKTFRPAYTLCVNKWYFDEIYEFFVSKIFLAASKVSYLFDKYIIDGIVNLIGYCAVIKSRIIRYFQNGNVQTYTAISLGGLCLISFFILGLWLYLSLIGG